MAALACSKNERPDPICGNSVDGTSFEQKVLPRFVDVSSGNSEFFLNAYRPAYINIQSPWKERLAGCSRKHFWEFGHALSEMSTALNDRAFEESHLS